MINVPIIAHYQVIYMDVHAYAHAGQINVLPILLMWNIIKNSIYNSMEDDGVLEYVF